MNSPQTFDEEKYQALLCGLECSEVMLSEILYRNRSDSEYYKKIYIENEKILTDIKNFKLKKHFKITDGEHGSAEYLESGVKYLTAENIKQGYVDITNVKYVSEQVHIRNKRAAVNENDILISIKGTLGEVALAEKSLIPCNMNRDVAIMKSLNKTTSLNCLVSIFLMTKYGRILSLREGSGGVQQMITLERLREFNVPLLQENFCLELQKCHKNFLALRDKSKSAYTSTETLLLKSLNLQNFTPSTKNTSVKTFAETFASGRLDAEYYQAKYDEILNFLKNFTTTSIPAEFDIFKNSGTNYSEQAQDVGVIKTKQIKNFEVDIEKIESYFDNATCNENKSEFLEKDDVIFATMGVGSLGKVSLFQYDGNKKFVTDSTLRIYRAKENSKILPAVLCLFLQTEIAQQIIYRYVVGSTGIINIYDNNIAKIPIPILPEPIQTEISAKIKESFDLREQSKTLLKAATRAVEIAIEEGEDKAMGYLEEMT